MANSEAMSVAEEDTDNFESIAEEYLTQTANDEEMTQVVEEEEKQSNSKLAQLPHTRVRNMMKLDSDLHIASQDSVFLVTKAAVSFSQKSCGGKCHEKSPLKLCRLFYEHFLWPCALTVAVKGNINHANFTFGKYL